MIILNLSLFDSSSLLESLAVEADDDDSYDVTEIFLVGEEESVDEESESSLLAETFRFLLFFFLFGTLLEIIASY